MPVREITSFAFKLVGIHHGTLLGTITIRGRWVEILHEHESVQFAYFPTPSLEWMTEPANSAPVQYKVGCLQRSHEYRDGLYLHGLSIEEFETMDGCSFSPSAAYLRSIIE